MAAMDRESNSDAIQSVLDATNHYAVISAPQSASSQELRQSYLRASVLTHPDKNCHRDATKAFQKVAAAWTVLGDEDARRRYDAELSMGRGGLQAKGNSQYQASVSTEQAFASFAFWTAVMSSEGGLGDLGETMYWAQRLSAAQRGEVPAEEPDALKNSMGSLALAAGIYAAGTAATVAGYARVGTFARRMAFVQGVGQIATLSQIPSVQDSVRTNASSAYGKAQDLSAAISKSYTDVKISVGQLGGPIAKGLGASLATAPCLSPGVENEERDSQNQVCSGCVPDPLLPAGAKVRIVGLKSAQYLNDQCAEVVCFKDDDTRYKIQLPHKGEVKLIKRQNLEALPPETAMQFI